MSRELFEDLLEGRIGVWEYLKDAASNPGWPEIVGFLVEE